MSYESGASSCISNSRQRGRVYGVPKKCWCGEEMIRLISKSNLNPYWRYYQCRFAATDKLRNDNHVFKWVDEAHLDEIKELQFKYSALEQQVTDMRSERMEFEKTLNEKIQMLVEKEMGERLEESLSEAKRSVKNMMILGVIGCMVLVVISKLT